MPNILLLSRYEQLGASSRYRFYQYLPYLQQHGFDITVAPLLNDRYLKRRYAGQPQSPFKTIRSYAQRVLYLLKFKDYDLVWLEKEVFPWLPHWFEKLLFSLQIPCAVDYDDAWFCRYNMHRSGLVRWFLERKLEYVARWARLVIAGNNYLAEWATTAGARWVEIIPTVIDLNRYPITSPPVNDKFTIGWIGSPITARYFDIVHSALLTVCQDGASRVVALGAGTLELPGVPVLNKPWFESSEVVTLKDFDVGIMPLWDAPRERGKCGLKLLQYMACARPVVGSPVGVNQEIVSPGINGYWADNPAQWISALQTLKADHKLRRKMGLAGRSKVESEYSLQVTAPKLAGLLHEAVTRRS